MQHIREHFAIPDISVPDLIRGKHRDFPTTFEAFHAYPTCQGWRLLDDFTIGTATPLRKQEPLENFLQPWLFFGLIFTVVQAYKRPILSYDDLVLHDGFITTEKLAAALEKWQRYESQNLDGIEFRMIRVEQALRIARRVMRKNCSYPREAGYVQPKPNMTSYVRPAISLSIMVLGETLSAVKAQILRATNSEVGGWHHDDGEGWGEPPYILMKMHKQGWCPRINCLWRSQLRSHATLLLASYEAYAGYQGFEDVRRYQGTEHKMNNCDENGCRVSAEDSQGSYRCAHAPGCNKRCGDMYGPKMDKVHSILSRGRAGIPLLKFVNDSDDSYELEVIEGEEATGDSNNNEELIGPMRFNYAAISHVWSDGFGNKTENKLYPCQLRFIKQHLGRLGPGRGPFWMDTLVVPVDSSESAKKLRKIAIGQIAEVFIKSTYSLVLDLGLMHGDPGINGKPTKAAMKIIASTWMSRLWTLQEAFLSRDIYFVFRDDGPPENNLIRFSDLSDRLNRPLQERGTEAPSLLRTALLKQVDERMRHCIIDHERRKRKKYVTGEWTGLPQKSGAMMLAHVWKAAKWRTTTNPLHEVLALVTLFNLEYQRSDSITNAGLLHRPRLRGGQTAPKSHAKADELMVELWKIFDRSFPNSIHPGFIFLSNDRVHVRGFGWAPRTWMSTEPIHPPDPIRTISATATLDLDRFHGLKVEYPGFLLTANKNLILHGQDSSRSFSFFANHNMDGYCVEPTNDRPDHLFLSMIAKSKKPLAIILSRPKPVDMPAEIALLVEVWSIQFGLPGRPRDCHPTEEDVENGEAERIFLCQIVKRVKISRLVGQRLEQVRHEVMTDTSKDNDICVAQELENNQIWYVDGFIEEAERHRVELHTNPLDKLLPNEDVGHVGNIRRLEPKMPPPIARASNTASPPEGEGLRRVQSLPSRLPLPDSRVPPLPPPATTTSNNASRPHENTSMANHGPGLSKPLQSMTSPASSTIITPSSRKETVIELTSVPGTG